MKKRRTKYIAAALFLLLFFLIPRREERPELYRITYEEIPDTLYCTVLLDHSLYAEGYSLGYLYEFFRRFESVQHCKIMLDPRPYDTVHWHRLLEADRAAASGEAEPSPDFLIINAQKDTVPLPYQERVISSLPLNRDNEVCVISRSDYPLLQLLNGWIAFFRQTAEYAQLERKFYRNYHLPEESGGTPPLRRISPYDEYFRKYAPIVGWDWRLIASLSYQESKFKAGVGSGKGALGLMQIKEAVARTYGIEDIYDPESNIKAGVLHLARLQSLFRKTAADSADLVRITLAAYNAGEGRVQDCQRLTAALGKDPSRWEDIAETIPLMNQKEYYRHDTLQLGRFQGKETLKFVKKITDRYETYRRSVVTSRKRSSQD